MIYKFVMMAVTAMVAVISVFIIGAVLIAICADVLIPTILKLIGKAKKDE